MIVFNYDSANEEQAYLKNLFNELSIQHTTVDTLGAEEVLIQDGPDKYKGSTGFFDYKERMQQELHQWHNCKCDLDMSQEKK